jgi:uncharacterized membrane protein
MLESVVPLVLLLNGLAAGVLVGTQLGGFPLLAALPADRYVHAHPFMPACLVGTVVGDVLLAALAPGAAPRALHAVAAALAASTVVVSLTKNVPINKWVQALDPDRLPADFARHDRRFEWGMWNKVRSWLVVLALVANCAALGLLL